MRTLLPLIAATGVLSLWSGFVSPPATRTGRWRLKLEAACSASGVGWATPRTAAAASAIAGVVGAALAAALTSSAPAAAVAGISAASWPWAYVRGRARKRAAALRDEWPDALGVLIASIRAGVSLPQACLDAVDRAGPGLRPGFVAFRASYRATGRFRTALTRLREELADPVADRVVVALEMAHEVGGNDLVRILQTLADFVRHDQRVRREVEARWSWTLTAAKLAAAAPWVVLVLMSTRPEAAAAYSGRSGAITIVLGAVATIVGYRCMLRAARLPVERRLT